MNVSTSVERGRRRTRLALLALTSTALGVSLAAPAQAQTSAYRQVDENGVDLARGGVKIAFEEGSIGAGAGRLAIIRSSGQDRNATNWDELQLYRTQVMTMAGVKETVQITRDGFASWESFSRIGSYGAFTSDDANGASLSGGGNAYSYAARDGGSVLFADPTNDSTSNPGTLCSSDASQYYCSLPPVGMSSPSGVNMALEYDLKFFADDPSDFYSPKNYSWRLARVISSAGYMIEFSYLDDNTTYYANFPPQTWWRRSGAAFSNTQVNNGAVVASVSYGYTGPSGYIDVTDTAGQTWRVSSGSIQRPGESTPGFQVSGSFASTFTVNRDGITTSYSRSVSSTTATMTVTDGLSHASTIKSNLTIGRPTEITDYLGNKTSYDYDTYGRLIRVTQPELGYVEYTLDGRGNAVQTQQVAKPGSGSGTLTSTAAYDASCYNAATCNQPNSVTDAGGHTTDYTYTSDGHVATVTGPAPNPSVSAIRPQTRFDYTSTAAGTQVSSVSACRTGDASSCLSTADESRTDLSYDANGNVASVTARAGDYSLVATTDASWSSRGDLVSVDGPLAGTDDTIYYRYDGARRQVGVTSPDPDGAGSQPRRTTRITRDAAGRATLAERGTVTDTSDTAWAAFSPAEGVATTWSGERKTVDALVSGGTTYAKTQYGYDAAGQLECTAVRMNSATWSSLPGACSLQPTGAAGPDRITRTSYDSSGNLTVSTAYGTAEQADEATTYTQDGQIASVRDGESNKTSYTYDGFDRLKRTFYPSPTKGANASSSTDFEELGYDNHGNITSRRLRDGQTLYHSYDSLNRRTYDDNPNTNVAEVDVGYTYNLLGHLTSAGDQNGWGTSWTYDPLGRMVSQASNVATTGFLYDLAGRTIRQTWGDGFYVTFDYDPSGGPTAVREYGSTPLGTFSYDALGRRTGVSRGNGTSTSYSYDPVSRLASFGQDLAGTGADLNVTFGYNPSGQIASRSSSNDAFSWTGYATGTSGYAADGLNRYSTAGSVTPTYDARGNTTGVGGTSYAYNTRNELYTTGGGSLWYRGPTGVLGQESGVGNLDWVGDHLATIQNAGIDRRYVYAPGEDTPLVWYEGPGTSDKRWLHTDERGSVIAVSDTSGNTLAINKYDEYGQPASGNLGRFGYTGQQWIAGLGLWDYKARMYLPSLGRFMQTDPIGYSDGLNWYNYVKSEPVNHNDPSGLEEFCVRVGGRTSTDADGTVVVELGRKWCFDTGPFGFGPGSAPSGPGGGGSLPAPSDGPPCQIGVACKLPPLEPEISCNLTNNFCGIPPKLSPPKSRTPSLKERAKAFLGQCSVNFAERAADGRLFQNGALDLSIRQSERLASGSSRDIIERNSVFGQRSIEATAGIPIYDLGFAFGQSCPSVSDF